MNKATRQLVLVQNKILRLQADLLRLREKGLSYTFLRKRSLEVLDLKASIGLR